MVTHLLVKNHLADSQSTVGFKNEIVIKVYRPNKCKSK